MFVGERDSNGYYYIRSVGVCVCGERVGVALSGGCGVESEGVVQT
jgi:hypothetical protein